MRKLMSLTFTLLVSGALMVASAAEVAQQQPSSPQVLDMRESDESWINDPHVREFYEVTVAAFSNGPARVDRAAYERRSREIFRALAVSRNMSPEFFVEHVSGLPGQMIQIVTREPETLESYDSFVVALFGPRSTSASP